jgi:site-specific recombinase XerD
MSEETADITRFFRENALSLLAYVRGTCADRARASLSELFVWAVEAGHLDRNPALNIKAPAENGRVCVLTEPNLEASARAATGASP